MKGAQAWKNHAPSVSFKVSDIAYEDAQGAEPGLRPAPYASRSRGMMDSHFARARDRRMPRCAATSGRSCASIVAQRPSRKRRIALGLEPPRREADRDSTPHASERRQLAMAADARATTRHGGRRQCGASPPARAASRSRATQRLKFVAALPAGTANQEARMKIVFHGRNAINFRHGLRRAAGGAARDRRGRRRARPARRSRSTSPSADVIVGVRLGATEPVPRKLRLWHAPAAGTDAIDRARLPAGSGAVLLLRA